MQQEITLTDAIRRLMLVQTTTPFEVRVHENDLQEFVRRVAAYNPTGAESPNAYSPADRK